MSKAFPLVVAFLTSLVVDGQMGILCADNLSVRIPPTTHHHQLNMYVLQLVVHNKGLEGTV
jgi:hypothetical protein